MQTYPGKEHASNQTDNVLYSLNQILDTYKIKGNYLQYEYKWIRNLVNLKVLFSSVLKLLGPQQESVQDTEYTN